MLRHILVLFLVTQTIVAHVPHAKVKRECAGNCGSVSSASFESWSSDESSSSDESDEEFANIGCDKQYRSDGSGSEEVIRININTPSREVRKGYRDYIFRKRVKTNLNLAVACEHDTIRIGCPNNYIIKIISANYGRTCNKYCNYPDRGNVTVTDCYCGSAKDVVSWYCTDANYCQLPVENYVFYDMCPGVYKYLEVVYDCIYVERCPDQTNMRFTTCTPCDQATCRNPNGNTVASNCVPGCVCTGNTLWSEQDNVCVSPDNCPWYNPAHPECGANEVFSPNATKCQPSCQNPVPEDPCPTPPAPGYICIDGKVRDERSGRCVSPCSCPCDSAIRQQ